MNWLKKLFGSSTTPAARAPLELPSTDMPMPEFPYPLVAVAGSSAVTEWRRWQAEWRKEGASAVLLGTRDTVDSLRSVIRNREVQPEEIIRASKELTVAEFFRRRQQENDEYEIEPEAGDWPEGKVAGSELSAHQDVLSKRPHRVVFITRIPTGHAWEIPAYLCCGGWNSCPDAAEQGAVLRYWAEKYGIEIYAITEDVVECAVERPPVTKEAALALAHEQFLFCSDIVLQGTETIELLAAGLQNAEAWYFWWD